MLKNAAALGFFVLVGLSAEPANAQVFMRCPGELLSPRQAIGRNEWAVKCGYLSREQADFMNGSHWFVAFKEACASYPFPLYSECVQRAPNSELDACIPALTIAVLCTVG